MGKTVYLVTGAAGFLGSHVCNELLERGDHVKALVLPGDKSVKYVPKAVEITEGDLCDVESLERFCAIPEQPKGTMIRETDQHGVQTGGANGKKGSKDRRETISSTIPRPRENWDIIQGLMRRH